MVIRRRGVRDQVEDVLVAVAEVRELAPQGGAAVRRGVEGAEAGPDGAGRGQGLLRAQLLVGLEVFVLEVVDALPRVGPDFSISSSVRSTRPPILGS